MKLGRSLRLLWVPVRLFSLRSVGGVFVMMAEWTPATRDRKCGCHSRGARRGLPFDRLRENLQNVLQGAASHLHAQSDPGGEPGFSQTREGRQMERLSACPAAVLRSWGDTLWERAGPPCFGAFASSDREGETLKTEGGRAACMVRTQWLRRV